MSLGLYAHRRARLEVPRSPPPPWRMDHCRIAGVAIKVGIIRSPGPPPRDTSSGVRPSSHQLARLVWLSGSNSVVAVSVGADATRSSVRRRRIVLGSWRLVPLQCRGPTATLARAPRRSVARRATCAPRANQKSLAAGAPRAPPAVKRAPPLVEQAPSAPAEVIARSRPRKQPAAASPRAAQLAEALSAWSRGRRTCPQRATADGRGRTRPARPCEIIALDPPRHQHARAPQRTKEGVSSFGRER